MAKIHFKYLAMLAMGLLLISCAAQKPQPAPFQAATFPADKYQTEVDNFLIILDGSTSMMDEYNGRSKLCIAAETASQMNQTIPEWGFTSGLRTFGQGGCVGGGATSLLYGLTQYNTGKMENALNKLTCTGGNTPLGKAIDMAGADLKSIGGSTAVIIVSDGIVLDNYPVAAAKNLKQQPGGNLCIYTILVGNNPGGKAVLQQMADAGECGFSVTADEIAGTTAMAGFVELALLSKKTAKAKPKPPPKPTPKPPPPVVKPTPGDRDGDGVLDSADRCPETPRGARVDDRGCWVIDTVMFDFDKSDIKKQFTYVLDEVAYVLENNPYVTVEVQGNTDSIGKESYNQKLSERRAVAVKKYLVAKGIASHRLKTKGFGATRPIDTNLTNEGRAKNRRVELAPVW